MGVGYTRRVNEPIQRLETGPYNAKSWGPDTHGESMSRYRDLPVVAVAMGIVLLLGATVVQIAAGSGGDLPPASDPDVQLTRAVYATNEAQTWAIETAEAVQIANTTPAPQALLCGTNLAAHANG